MEIVSNCTGSFAIENSKIIDKVLFKDPVSANLMLEKGEQTEEEKSLLNKHPSAKVVTERRFDLVILISNIPEMKEAASLVVKEKLRRSVADDNFIVQTSAGLSELDKTANLLSKRLREWYELYNPEISRAMPDHEMFVNTILSKSKKELLKEINVTNSMGADIAKIDLDAIFNLANQLKTIFELKHVQEAYLEIVMKRYCPNLTEVAGTLIGAKILTLAGSLKRLVSFPASTIQVLGAEKALFRHLRNKRNRPPKFGILHEHALLSKVNPKNRGKMARTLADKMCLASKVDYFKGKFAGKELLKQVEDKAEQLK